MLGGLAPIRGICGELQGTWGARVAAPLPARPHTFVSPWAVSGLAASREVKDPGEGARVSRALGWHWDELVAG